MSKSLKFLYFLLVIVHFSAFAQPSFYISVNFKFFEKNKPLTQEEFDKKYIIINQSKYKNKAGSYYFNPNHKTFSIGGDVVYNDLIIDIIKQKDTMQLVFKTKEGTRKKFAIEHLSFKEGTFFIEEEKLSRLDFQNSKSNYYNALLTSITDQTFQQKENFLLKEINKQKLKYGIDDDDFLPKKEIELIEISGLKDHKILTTYRNYLVKKNFVDQPEHDRIEDGKVIYAPDNRFKIFIFKGESCGANCHTFYNSFLHFNLDKKYPTVVETNFFPIDKIIQMDESNYIVLHSGYDGGGIYSEEHYVATIITLNKNKIKIGKFSLSNMHQSNKNETEIQITARQSELEDGTPFGMKFNPQNKMVEYQYFITNQNTGDKRRYSGKLIYENGIFRWLSKSG